ncbi:O-antigen ligase family protein [Alkalihalobacillus clausii]|uniref:O-antigen ligase family protein n=1 Tax=Shouchella clausii TaxID=79880 RepID=UPI001C241C97|nr:O-antigen ligase [Shouchella clausii]MBU8597381.1 O-antigen ligase family protein [Shouchella clausii]
MNLEKLEKIFVIIAVFLLTDNAFNFLNKETMYLNDDTFEGDSTKQAVLLSVYALTFILLFLRKGMLSKTITYLFKEKWLLFLMVIVVISFMWSHLPELSSRRVVAMVGSTLFGLYLSVRFNLRTIVKLLSTAFGVIIVFNLFGIVFFSEYTTYVETRGEVWQGFFSHKNHLARFAILAFVTLLVMFLTTKKSRYKVITAALTIASLLLLIKSFSATAYILLFIVIAAIPLLRRFRLKNYLEISVLAFMLSGLSGLALYALFNANQLLAYVGRDLTLTGRTDIWAAAIDAVAREPFFGYGFSGFWAGYYGPSQQLLMATGKDINHAHNGFIDVALQIGIVGLIVFAILLGLTVFRSIKMITSNSSYLNLWPVLYLILLISMNISENVLLRQNDLYWILFVTVSICVYKHTVSAKEHNTEIKRTRKRLVWA